MRRDAGIDYIVGFPHRHWLLFWFAQDKVCCLQIERFVAAPKLPDLFNGIGPE
jgi:hypothetical protein